MNILCQRRTVLNYMLPPSLGLLLRFWENVKQNVFTFGTSLEDVKISGDITSRMCSTRISKTSPFSASDLKLSIVFTVGLQNILKRATNQFLESLRKRLPWNLPLAKKHMLAYKSIEKGLHTRCFAWNKLNFLQALISSTSRRDISRTPANI